MTVLLPRLNLAATYCLKYGAIMKSWPKVRLTLQQMLSDVISPKFEEFLIGLVFLVNPVMVVSLVESIDLVALGDPINQVKPLDSIEPIY